MSYSGRIYDGPWEGQNYSHPDSSFWIALYQPISLAWWKEQPDIPATIDVNQAEYCWSHPLRAWVFNWNSAPAWTRRRAA